jgi:nucleotide-binding universal stress UspA family protein
VKRSGPVIIGYDGTPASEWALRESAALFAPRPALVVVVWEAGRAFEAATLPERVLERPPAGLDVRTAFEAETAAYEAAERLAEQGAALASEAGLDASGLAVADEATVAQTLIRLAREHDAQTVVIGAHRHHELRRVVFGSTLSDLLRRSPCPILVCGAEPDDEH